MPAGLDDRYAAGYDGGMQEYLKLHTVERCAAFLTPHLRPGMSLLDAGCGPGTLTVGLARFVAPGRVVAIDASADEVEKTRRGLQSIGASARVEVGDVRALPCEDAAIDAVFSHAVLDYLPDPARAIEEFGRVLRPGGVIGLRSWVNSGTVSGPTNGLIEQSFALFHRAISEYGGTADGLGPVLGSLLKEAGFERIFVRPSFERVDSRDEWESFCRACGAAYSGGRFMDLAVGQGWIDELRRAEIAEAWENLAADTSFCLGFAWVEAVAFKPA